MIINNDYSLGETSFQNSKGTWTLSGTESKGYKADTCVDTWRCGNEFIECSRSQLKEAELKKRIWNVDQ